MKASENFSFSESSKKILITGLPGSGKTTLVEKVIKEFNGKLPVAGFITKEIRENGQRCGFELLSLDGRRALLSHVSIKSPYRVGKYGVDLEGFESFLEKIPFFDTKIKLAVVDEIGKMECLSEKFRKLISELINRKTFFLATIGLHQTPFMEKIKARQDGELITITPGNRNMAAERIILTIQKYWSE
jgi:nucleoside-triphosphatase